MKKELLTLAIDTSCDETSAAVVRGLKVLSNVLPSQTELHAKFGGIVPSVARLAHQERIDGVVAEALRKAKTKIEEIDQIAVTIGPGLAIALEVGINKAKELAEKYDKPLVPVNHMEGHLLSAFAEKSTKQKAQNSKDTEGIGHKAPGIENGLKPYAINPKTPNNFNYLTNSTNYPTLGLLISGKHTEIVLVKELGDYEIIGETLDDACGEAFDKCGRLLGLGYPAGPIVAKFAEEKRKEVKIVQYNKNVSTHVAIEGTEIELPLSMYNSPDLNFSYSGLKTAFRQLIEKLKAGNRAIDQEMIKSISILFEEAAFRPIIHKLEKAIKPYGPKAIWLGGGVASNLNLRRKLRVLCKNYNLKLFVPETSKLTTDNAAMVAIVANVKAKSKKHKIPKIDRIPGLRLDQDLLFQ